MNERKTRILISANTSWYVHNFRMSLIDNLKDNGYDVFVAAPQDEFSDRIQKSGCAFFPVTLDNKGTNPLREIKTILDYRKLYSRIRPDLILHFTPKPNIFGSLAAQSLNIPCINNIAGLGTAFIRGGLLLRTVRFLYRISQRHPYRVFFQNPDDMKLFIESGLVKKSKADLLPGSGVDLERFSPREKIPNSNVTFLLVARLIWDKGVGEFVEAARRVKKYHPESEFQLLGFVDTNNPSALSEDQIHQWEAEGILTWHGRTDDVRPYMAEADCVVLPSYREGTPKSLLEAASMAKPLITTDATGCREVVDDGINGFLCRLKDYRDLADKMVRMIELGPEARKEMGRRGREKMVRKYNEKIIFSKYLQVITGGINTR